MEAQSWRGLLPETVEVWTGPIYHYTDPPGLLGELQDRVLWATEALGMNDLAEVEQGWRYISEWLETQSQDDDVIKDMRSAAEGFSSASERAAVFMCCASTQKDDASQWRLYANGGRGYAIELDPTQELAVLSAHERSAKRATTEAADAAWKGWGHLLRNTVAVSPWLRVLYTEAQKSSALEGLVANARQAKKQVDEAESEEEFRAAAGDFATTLISGLETLAQLMKSPGYAGENEVRTVVRFLSGSELDAVGGGFFYRASDYGVVRYAKLITSPSSATIGTLAYKEDYGELPLLPIRSVWLGPLLSAQNNRASIESLLVKSGFENRMPLVCESEVPLR